MTSQVTAHTRRIRGVAFFSIGVWSLNCKGSTAATMATTPLLAPIQNGTYVANCSYTACSHILAGRLFSRAVIWTWAVNSLYCQGCLVRTDLHLVASASGGVDISPRSRLQALSVLNV